MSRDPFYSVKDKVVGLLTKLRSDFSRFESLSSRSGEFTPLLNQLKQQISAIDTDCKDLAQTIVIVESNRARFPSISENELNSRKQFVSESQQQLNSYQEQLRRSAQKAAGDNRRDLMAPGQSSRFNSAAAQQVNREQDDYVSSAQNQQQALMKQQDLVLDDMDGALARLANINEDINTELTEQGQMLDQLDGSIDEAQGSMNIVLKKMDKLLKTSDRGRICCIIALFFLAILLIIIIFYA